MCEDPRDEGWLGVPRSNVCGESTFSRPAEMLRVTVAWTTAGGSYACGNGVNHGYNAAGAWNVAVQVQNYPSSLNYCRSLLGVEPLLQTYGAYYNAGAGNPYGWTHSAN